MVVLTGPCMSLEARGTLNDTLTYAVLRRTCYVKSHFIPQNPSSNAQTGVRCMTKFLTQEWAKLSTTLQAKFKTLATKQNISPYHAFLKLNTKQWANHLMPIINPESTEQPNNAGQLVTLYTYGRRHEADLLIQNISGAIHTAEFCFATSPGLPGTRDTAKIIASEPDIAGDWFQFYATWIAPNDDTYYVKARHALTSGNASVWNEEI